MMSITPRWLLSLLPWVQVDGGIYRVNRTKVELSKADRIWVDLSGEKANFSPDALRGIPLFSQASESIIKRLADGFKTEQVSLGSKLIGEGEDGNKFFVIAQGQVEVLSKGVHGTDLRLALLTDGEFFGENDLVSDQPSDVTIRTLTPCVLLTLSRKDLDSVLSEAPAMRISTRYGAPTPDDLDELLALVWKKPAFILAHPKAIAAFERECTWRGVPPVTMNLFGTPVITWRGVPLVPCDKLEMKNRYQSNQWFGTTSILLLRIGEADQGVVGLHQAGIPGEIQPSLSARLMGLDSLGVASYLLTLYFSCAVLTDDALGVLENVEVGYYHDYEHRKPQGFDNGSGI